MNTSNNTKPIINIMDLVDCYLAIPGITITIIILLLNLLLSFIFLISFCFYLFKPNPHHKIILLLLFLDVLANILFDIIYIIQFCFEIPFLLDKAQRAAFVLSSNLVGMYVELGMLLLFCYLCVMYAKTLRDLNLIRRCTFVVMLIIVMVMIMIVIINVLLSSVSVIVCIVLVVVLKDVVDAQVVMTIYGLVTLPFFASTFSLDGLCALLTGFYSLRLIVFIFGLAKRISDRGAKWRNFLNLGKIVFLVVSINVVFTFHVFLLVFEVVYVFYGHVFWLLALWVFQIVTLWIVVLFFFSFGPG